MKISYPRHIFFYHLMLAIFTFIFGYLCINSLFDINHTYSIMVSLIAFGCFIGTIKTGVDLHNERREYDKK